MPRRQATPGEHCPIYHTKLKRQSIWGDGRFRQARPAIARDAEAPMISGEVRLQRAVLAKSKDAETPTIGDDIRVAGEPDPVAASLLGPVQGLVCQIQ